MSYTGTGSDDHLIKIARDLAELVGACAVAILRLKYRGLKVLAAWQNQNLPLDVFAFISRNGWREELLAIGEQDHVRNYAAFVPEGSGREPLPVTLTAIPIRDAGKALGILMLLSLTPGGLDERAISLARLAAIELGWLLQYEGAFSLAQTELAAARQVQETLLPRQLPEVKGVDISGQTVSAGVMGGDYFDFILGPRGTLFIVVADVMGKGMASALLMLSLRSTLRSILCELEEHDRIIRHLNKVVGEDLRRMGSFATLCLLGFARGPNLLTCSNAGHHPPMVFSVEGTDLLNSRGIALGLSENYPESPMEERPLRPGEGVVLYTDGLIDARNNKGEKFGRARLEEAVLASAAQSAADIKEAILERVYSFTKGQEQRDDITLAVLKFRGRR